MDQENQKNQETQESKTQIVGVANGMKPDMESRSKARLANQRVLLVKAEREDVPVLAGFLGELFSLEEDFESDMDKQSRGLMLALDNPDIVDVYKVILNGEASGEAGGETKETAGETGEYAPDNKTCSSKQPGAELIGIIVLHKFISTAEGTWTERIEDLYIRPEYRRSGMGTEIINGVIRLAQKDGLTRIILQADKDNQPALNFYRRYGFEEMNLVSFVIRP